MAKKNSSPIRRRALRIDQDPDHPLYLFSLSGEDLLKIADISRVSRSEAGKLLGYQRAEVKQHVKDIVDYLDSEQVLFPHPIILALSSRVIFRSSRGPDVNDGCATAGTLEIPPSSRANQKPAWIVDGQQRALALSKCRRKTISIPIRNSPEITSRLRAGCATAWAGSISRSCSNGTACPAEAVPFGEFDV